MGETILSINLSENGNHLESSLLSKKKKNKIISSYSDMYPSKIYIKLSN